MPPHQAAPQQAAAHQAAPRTTEETQRRQEITQDKWVADIPPTAPRAQAPPNLKSGLQAGPEIAGTSHLSDDLHRYVSLLVRHYVDKRPRPMAIAGPTIDSPVLDTDMLEEDWLAWQQLAAGTRKTPDGDHPMLGGDDDVIGDDWESLDS